ncbi:MAG TPA: SpoIIE family protein phosphatase, partial [Xanthobacteraceae bacterium]|nr:SpoIIE family protein phosphatase [Xanthobacteraceae bacterium]
YTDGITEASNRAGEFFRIQRLMDIAQRFADRPPHDLMLAVTDSVDRFSVGTLQADDITCLVVRRNLAA